MKQEITLRDEIHILLDDLLDSGNPLVKAICIATLYHQSQKDKSGQPYILHPLRVMNQMKTENEKVCAVLHDVVEDTSLELEDLLQYGFAPDQIWSIDCLTKKEKTDYEGYIYNLKENETARKVKLEDIKDNCILSRLKGAPNLSQKDLERFKKYIWALNYLKKETEQ